MNSEFSGIGSLTNTSNKDHIRAKAVEAALVLLKTTMSNSAHSTTNTKLLLNGDLISPLADKIIEALNLKE
tara:strand:- start:2069 stop:2281 length:213 start_codon:yes stop_codon:yes gene_type:complete